MSDVKEFVNEGTALSEEQNNQMEMMAALEGKTPSVGAEFGSEVTGKVVSISDESVFVDISLRNEAVLAKSEVLDDKGECTVKVGDELKLYVISSTDDETIVSKSLKKGKASKQILRDILDQETPVEGRISGMNKGGFNVTVLGKKAFCPFSSIDLKYPEDPASYMGKTFEFIVSRIENRGNNIVLTRIPLLSGDIKEKIEEIKATIVSGEPVSGTVTRTTNFGAFVDLGGIEGLVHVSELSWDRDEETEQIVKTGDVITVKVISVEEKEPLRDSRISLSMKRLANDPWDSEVTKLNVGDQIDAVVTRLVGFGAFVRLFAGVEGLIRTEDMGWGRVRKPSDICKKGESVKVTITAVDLANRKVDCSMKDASQDPWAAVATKYAEGTVVSGTVADQKEYGFFVDLDEDITGLLPNRRIGKDKVGSVKKGDVIEVTIDTLDLATRKIGLAYGAVEAVEVRAERGERGGNDRNEAMKYMKQQDAKAASGESDFAFMLKNALKK